SKGPDGETIIKLTSIHLEHNHLLVPKNASFATEYWKLTAEIKDLIKKYTLCDLDVPSQVQLLHELFSKATIIDYDMKNYVYKFWHIHSIQGGDTIKLFEHFEKERAKDSDCIFTIVDNNFKSRIVVQAVLPDETSESYRWVLQQIIKATGVQPGAFIIDADLGLESVIPEVYPNTYLLYCIWHIRRNIEKQLAKSLGDHYADFLKAFYRIHNVLCKEAFGRYWQQLMAEFLQQ
ncbi:7047_t:CDS:2, partial [Scutellospora calospora]